MNILVFGESSKFNKYLCACLEHTVIFKEKIKLENIEQKIDIVIFNSIRNAIKQDELEKILAYDFDKFIFIEDAKDLYLNSKIKPPFCVYKKILSKNNKSKKFLICEETIKRLKPNCVIFRVSEIYGHHIDFGTIHDLLSKRKLMIERGKRNFLYEGDLIQAIEVAVEVDAKGIFDLASEETVCINEEFIETINRYRKKPLRIRFRNKKINITYTCENFKYYSWEPCTKLVVGLNAIKRLNEVKYAKQSYV
jgi:dTDP-4-dehydrorhamnose reductase